ncbi:hypothetical protein KVR01_006306 [Diaporthe batatas]|uniref:uncharacterized protein n=1 Tax=Diaporthe batatas TaxID=748121 RepID=UPI001D037CD5|nr:uncharacterized protein KVR01_006306 [Diaporthe batatas]KAG8164388.1 hypothetical protein KVR01_006306 [Diaporthe batatas]
MGVTEEIWGVVQVSGALVRSRNTLRQNIRTVRTVFVNPLRPNYTASTWDIEYAEGQKRYTGPPSDDIERSWDDLMAAINFNVSGELASPVEGETFHYPDGHYLLGLEVFHGLHCVNIMRRTVSSGALHANSTMDNELWAKHVWHCLDYLRQYVQCNADLTPMFFEYIGRSSVNHDHSRNLALRKGTVHTCADFEGIHGWVMDQIHQS